MKLNAHAHATDRSLSNFQKSRDISKNFDTEKLIKMIFDAN